MVLGTPIPAGWPKSVIYGHWTTGTGSVGAPFPGRVFRRHWPAGLRSDEAIEVAVRVAAGLTAAHIGTKLMRMASTRSA